MEKQTAQGVLFYQIRSDPLHKLLKKKRVRNVYSVVVVKSKKKQNA